jgi:hypothetical protein
VLFLVFVAAEVLDYVTFQEVVVGDKAKANIPDRGMRLGV